MTEPLIVQRDSALKKKPLRWSIRGSTAQGEIDVPTPGSNWWALGPFAIVRCGSCDHRLFDVHPSDVRLDAFEPNRDRFLWLERKCPSCRRFNVGGVTGVDGRQLTGPGALAGRWRCECGHSLGIVAPR